MCCAIVQVSASCMLGLYSLTSIILRLTFLACLHWLVDCRLDRIGDVHPFNVLEKYLHTYSRLGQWMLPVLPAMPKLPLEVCCLGMLMSYLYESCFFSCNLF